MHNLFVRAELAAMDLATVATRGQFTHVSLTHQWMGYRIAECHLQRIQDLVFFFVSNVEGAGPEAAAIALVPASHAIALPKA